MNSTITIFTLNCWGIPFVSADRQPRMTAIAEEIATGKYDFVCLQEVWSKDDFDLIRRKAHSVLPYSHYFFSGVIGSGLCIFSRSPIEDVFFHQWAVNGYAHKVHHGDWFGGKGVALSKVTYEGLKVYIYTAHLHAEYDRNCDEYMAHRVTQAFDTSQLIQHTSEGAHIVVLGGDLNAEPGDLAYRIIRHNAQLFDSCLQSNGVDVDRQGTNGAPWNSYTNEKELMQNPHGKRIDYILYRAGRGVQANVESYSMPLSDPVPGHLFSYSDHEAVVARLAVTSSPDFSGKPEVAAERISCLKEAVSVCDDALSNIQSYKKTYWISASFALLVLLCTVSWDSPFKYVKMFNVFRVFVTLILCFTVFMGTVWTRMESNGVLAGKLGMEIVLSMLNKDNVS